jgi:hypothetical protein
MRYYISACSIFILTFLLPFARTVQATEKADTLSREQLDSLLSSTRWIDHLTFAEYLAKFPQYDTCWAVESLVKLIDSEANNPSTTGRDVSFFLTYPQIMIRQSVSTIGVLNSNVISILYDEKSKYNAKTQSLINTALAMLRDESVHDEIRNYMIRDLDPFIREMLAMSIGAYRDTLDIPILLEAYKDTFNTVVHLHYALPGHSMSETVYPVAWEAFKVLIEVFEIIPDDKSPNGYRPYKRGK